MRPETDLLDLFDGCSQSNGEWDAGQREASIRQQLSVIPGGAATAADYFDLLHSLDSKRAHFLMADTREKLYNAGHTTALVLWYDTQQQSITRPEIALQISEMDGGRTCIGFHIKIWCSTMRGNFPKMLAPLSEQDIRKR